MEAELDFRDFLPAIGGIAGAFVAAWAGAQMGFRRNRKERALDRRVSWHEEAIQSLARYEEQLERLRRHSMNTLVIQRSKPEGAEETTVSGDPAPLPPTFRAPAKEWALLADIEERARNALRLGDLYTEGRTRVECSVALSSTVDLVSRHWFDVSPEPQVQWADLSSRALRVANLRRSLQESLRIVLELDGLLPALLGTKYRKWRELRALNRLRSAVTNAS